MQYTGLTDAQVKERRTRGLGNTHVEKASKSEGRIIAEHLFTYFNALNLFLFVLVLTTGRWRNGLFMGTVLFNSCIGIVQSIRSKRLLDRMKIMHETKVRTLRNGEWTDLSTVELVVDDVIELYAGIRIPADCVILEGVLETDESMLSGESESVRKGCDEHVYSGTVVLSGSCTAMVIRTGRTCVSADIIHEAKKERTSDSLLNASLKKMIRIISVVIIPLLVLLYFTHVRTLGMTRDDAILKTVAAVIGMIPEGLVVLTNTALAVSAVRLARRNVLIQDLYAIESIARVDTICLDKTGTLTKGTMSVKDVKVSDGFEKKQAYRLIASYACGDDHPNPTQKALREYFREDIVYEKKDYLPFSSQRKYGGASFECGSVYIGAGDFLLPGVHIQGTRNGTRVLVAAYSHETVIQKDTLPSDLVLMAVISIQDNLRDNVTAILDYFEKQGTDVRIISGDDPETASQVALMAGVRNGDLFVDMSKTEESPDELVRKYTVFGRALPHQKKELVEALKKEGRTVAMTGDGVNDVPAFRSADVSIAMASGTSAARDASTVVLLDDDFGTVVDTINEGRRVINNIIRAASMYFVKTVFSILLSVTVIVMGRAYPFLPIHLTVLSAFGVGIPTFLLQMEPSFEKTDRNSLSGAFRKALPSGLSVFFLLIGVTYLKTHLHLQDVRFQGIFLLVTGAVYILTLFRVYRPWTKMRFAVIGTMAFFYAIACFGFGRYIYVDYRGNDLLICVILIVCMPVLIDLTDRLSAWIGKMIRSVFHVK